MHRIELSVINLTHDGFIPARINPNKHACQYTKSARPFSKLVQFHALDVPAAFQALTSKFSNHDEPVTTTEAFPMPFESVCMPHQTMVSESSCH